MLEEMMFKDRTDYFAIRSTDYQPALTREQKNVELHQRGKKINSQKPRVACETVEPKAETEIPSNIRSEESQDITHCEYKTN